MTLCGGECDYGNADDAGNHIDFVNNERYRDGKNDDSNKSTFVIK